MKLFFDRRAVPPVQRLNFISVTTLIPVKHPIPLAAAKKSGAEIIYTSNVQYFVRIAPELKARIRTPPIPNP